jgi:hypothetical protein
MKKLRIVRLRTTATAATQLDRLRLSQADMHIILCFGRRLRGACTTIYLFDEKQRFADKPELAHLLGISLVVLRNSIIDVCLDCRSPSQKEAERSQPT